MNRRATILGGVAALCMLLVPACQYEVPITATPTRNVDQALLGDWLSLDGKENMKVRRLEENVYVVDYDGDLFRAYHSDVGNTAFVTVQDLNSNDRKYAYVLWKLSNEGKTLRLRSVADKIVPKDIKDSATVVTLLTKNAVNPELLGEEIEFRKQK